MKKEHSVAIGTVKIFIKKPEGIEFSVPNSKPLTGEDLEHYTDVFEYNSKVFYKRKK